MKDSFIKNYPKTLTQQECKSIIARFEKDPNRKDLEYLPLTLYSEWKETDDMLFSRLSVALKDYESELNSNHGIRLLTECQVKDTGYLIRKYPQNKGKYNWMSDTSIVENRAITYMWFLNDVKEGGEVVFKSGKPIKPKAGTLLLFPCTWNFMHSANEPISNDKYIIQGHISRFPLEQQSEKK